MERGSDDDSYVVDDEGDVITELVSEGVEVTYTLPDEFERITLSGTAAINGTGNILDNWLVSTMAGFSPPEPGQTELNLQQRSAIAPAWV